MTKKSESLLIVQDDIRRYKNNKLGQWLTYGGLAFSCLYIMLLYSFNDTESADTTWFVMLMGVSVLLTLVMLLTAFLCSEGVKSYNKNYCYVLLVLAVIEIVRIFIFPRIAWNNQAYLYTASGSVVSRDYFGIALSQSACYTLLVVYLVISAVLYAAAAIYSYYVCIRHEQFEKKISEGTVNIEQALVTLEQEEIAAAEAVAAAAETAEEDK